MSFRVQASHDGGEQTYFSQGNRVGGNWIGDWCLLLMERLLRKEIFVVRASGNSAAMPYVQGVRLNGQAFTKENIDRNAIANGGTLAFVMSAEAKG